MLSQEYDEVRAQPYLLTEKAGGQVLANPFLVDRAADGRDRAAGGTYDMKTPEVTSKVDSVLDGEPTPLDGVAGGSKARKMQTPNVGSRLQTPTHLDGVRHAGRG